MWQHNMCACCAPIFNNMSFFGLIASSHAKQTLWHHNNFSHSTKKPYAN